MIQNLPTQQGQIQGNEIAFGAFKHYGYLPSPSPTTAPIINIDRVAMNEFQLRIAEIALTQMAWIVNMLTKKGAIYNQIILPPDEAQMKYAAMQGGQHG